MPSSNEFKLPDFKPIVEQLDGKRNTVKIKAGPGFYHSVDKQLKKYKHVPELFRPALIKIGDYVRMEMIPRTFKDEGPGWAPLSKRTVIERVRAGYQPGPILRRTGDLYRSLTEKSHPQHIEIIKVGKYARIEIGSSSKKFIENQMGMPTTHLPARPMIPGVAGVPITARDRMAIESIIRKAVTDRINRRAGMG